MLNYISRSQKRAINNIIPVPVNLSIVFQTVTEAEEEEEERKKTISATFVARVTLLLRSGNERIRAKTKA